MTGRIISGILLLLMFLFVFGLVRACWRGQPEVATVLEETAEDIGTAATDVAENVSDVVEEVVDDISDSLEADNSDAPESAPDATIASTGYNSKGRYHVVVGNFRKASNADDLLNKLSDQGFDHAKSVQYKNSTYHTVIVYQSNSISDAQKVSVEFRNDGYDSYVNDRR